MWLKFLTKGSLKQGLGFRTRAVSGCRSKGVKRMRQMKRTAGKGCVSKLVMV